MTAIAPANQSVATPDRGNATPISSHPLLPLVGVAALALFPLVVLRLLGPQGSLKWINNYGIQILIYVMLGWGLNIVVGLAGLLDLGYVAFYAVGAYSYALLSTTFGLSFWICLPLAGLLAVCLGVILGFPVLRLRGDYLAIVTLAFGEIIRLVLINWTDLSNGPSGISSIPRVTFFGIPFVDGEGGFASRFGLEFSPIQRTIFLFWLILALALLTNAVTLRLRRLLRVGLWAGLGVLLAAVQWVPMLYTFAESPRASGLGIDVEDFWAHADPTLRNSDSGLKVGLLGRISAGFQ